jgi:hypothetical protein
MTSRFEFATPFNSDDVALMEFLADGATSATGSAGTPALNNLPADLTPASLPSPENRSESVLDGVAGGLPYLPTAATTPC